MIGSRFDRFVSQHLGPEATNLTEFYLAAVGERDYLRYSEPVSWHIINTDLAVDALINRGELVLDLLGVRVWGREELDGAASDDPIWRQIYKSIR